MNELNKTVFAPQLYIPKGITDISFYEKAFGAVELRRFSNDDGSIHVSELSINGALFHLHEVTANLARFIPESILEPPHSSAYLFQMWIRSWKEHWQQVQNWFPRHRAMTMVIARANSKIPLAMYG